VFDALALIEDNPDRDLGSLVRTLDPRSVVGALCLVVTARRETELQADVQGLARMAGRFGVVAVDAGSESARPAVGV